MTERLDTELLITAGVKGLNHLDRLIDAIETAGGNTDQLREAAEKLKAEWDDLTPQKRAKALHDIGRAANASAKDLGLLGQKAHKATDAFDRLRGIAIKLSAALGALWAFNKAKDFFGSAIVGAASLEEQLAKVQAQSSATAQEMALIKAKAESLGASTRFTARESAEGFEVLARAGLSAREQIESIGSVLATAQSESIGMADAAQYILDAVSIMGGGFDEAARYADALAKGASQAATSVPQLANAIEYAGQYAKEAGLDIEELVGVLDALAESGVRGEKAGTALRNIFAQLQNPASQASQALRELNIDSGNFYDVIDGLAGAGARGQAAINAFGTEAGPALRALLSQGSSAIIEYADNIDQASGNALKKAAVMDNTFAGAFAALGSAWDSLKNKLGEPFLEVLSDRFRKLSDTIRELSESGRISQLGTQIAAAFGKALDKVLAFIKALDFDAILSKVAAGFGVLENVASKLTGTFSALKTAMQTVKIGFYAIGTAASAVFTMIAGALEGLTRIPAKIASVFGDNRISNYLTDINTGLKTLTDDLAQNTAELSAEIKRTADDMVGNLSKVAQATEQATQAMSSQFNNIGLNARSTADEIAEATNRIISTAVDPAAFQSVRIELTRLRDSSKLTADEYKNLLESVSSAEVIAQGMRNARSAMQQTLAEFGVTAVSSAESVNNAVRQILETTTDPSAIHALRAELEALQARGKLTTALATELYTAVAKNAQAEVAAAAQTTAAEDAKQAEIRETIALRDQAAQSAREAFARLGVDMDAINTGIASSNRQMIRDLITGLEQAKAAGQDTAKLVSAAFEQMLPKLNTKEELAAFNDALEKTGTRAELTKEQLAQLGEYLKVGADAAREAAKSTNEYSNSLLDTINKNRAARAEAARSRRATEDQTDAIKEKTKATENDEEKTETWSFTTSSAYANAADAVRETGEAAKDSARDMSNLARSAKDTADQIAASLAGIRGDTEAQAKLQQDQKLRELRAKLAEAKARGNGEEIRQYQRAINLQRQLYAEQQEQAKAKTVKSAEKITLSSTPSSAESSNTKAEVDKIAGAWDARIAEAERRGAERAKRELLNELHSAAKRKAR